MLIRSCADDCEGPHRLTARPDVIEVDHPGDQNWTAFLTGNNGWLRLEGSEIMVISTDLDLIARLADEPDSITSTIWWMP